MPKKEKVMTTPQAAAEAAVAEFADRWEKWLVALAQKCRCECHLPQLGHQELDHQPDCPVAMFCQAGRLMREEAVEARERACRAEI